MSGGVLRLAVVGHTNTGKTSLMRTLLRDAAFGEVDDRPAVTKSVDTATLRVDGQDAITLADTPGLEDSIALLKHLDQLRAHRQEDGIAILGRFLEEQQSGGRFVQEAAGIKQVLDSDAALYVIDARDRVLGKHRDELAILAQCARPVVPILNFTASDGARTDEWREHLRRVNLHAVAEYDTVVFSLRDEERLFEKLASLLDASAGDVITRVVRDRRDQRASLVRGSALLLAELLLDVAAFAVRVDRDRVSDATVLDGFRDAVREREQGCVTALLELHRFRREDLGEWDLPIEQGAWGIDLFSPEAMKRFGVRAGSGAAAGAMVGLTIDVMVGGLSGGAGALTGAAIGGLLGTVQSHGRRLVDRIRGASELRCDDATLRLLAARQLLLTRALLVRGHAAMDAIDAADAQSLEQGEREAAKQAGVVIETLGPARAHPKWSRLDAESGVAALEWSSTARAEVVDQAAGRIANVLDR